ncbi:MAG: hypothetical protein JWL73_820 [Actinomycetia bacterium]|nr:hypothetical protein [Actinomycetes bacterium]
MGDHRRTSWIQVAGVAVAVALMVLGAPSAAQAGPVSPLDTVFPAPPREVSPFSAPTEFCTRETTPPGPIAVASGPGVTPASITVVALTPATVTVPAGDTPIDPAAELASFAKLVNDCGGVRGRKLDLQVVTTTDDPAADCQRATTFHPFAVVSWTGYAAAACVAGPNRTVMIASGANVPDPLLAGTQGRLAVSNTPKGTLRARVLDLVASGRLDGKRVAIITEPGEERAAGEIRAILTAAEPSRRIAVGGGAPGRPVDVLLTTSFDPAAARSASVVQHDLAVYSFGAPSDDALAAIAAAGGPSVVPTGKGQLYTWISPELAQYRSGAGPSGFARMCNKAITPAAVNPNAPSSTTSTIDPTLPDSSSGVVTQMCLAMRTLARALYLAGDNPTQPSLVRALYRLPYVDQPFGGPVPRPNQVVNEPVTRARHVVVLAGVKSPCPHPQQADRLKAPCWVPLPGWTHGRAVNARL